MARAYSDDLRRKLLEAHRQGEGTLIELAERFRVSEGWARKISATLYRTGLMERPRGGKRGPRNRINADAEQYLRAVIRKQPDLTLAEMSQRLERERGIVISVSRLWTVLKDLGLRLKKSHSTLPSRIPKGSAHNAISGGKRHRNSTRSGSSS